MQSKSIDDAPPSLVEKLKSVKDLFEQLQADLQRQQQEITRLRQERDAYRHMVVEQLKAEGTDPKDWEQFDDKDYPLTVEDLLSVIKTP